MSSVESKEIGNSRAVLITLGLFVLVLYLVFIVAVMMSEINSGDSITTSLTGAFGDSFGVLTSLFSGLAAFLVYLTLVAQRKVLETTESELELTRAELTQTRNDQKVHAFENTFYKLLGILNDYKDNIQFNDGKKTHEGDEALRAMQSQINSVYCAFVRDKNKSGEVIRDEQGNHYYYKWMSLLTDTEQREVVESLEKVVRRLTDHSLSGYLRQLMVILDYLAAHMGYLDINQRGILHAVLRASLPKRGVQLLLFLSKMDGRDYLERLRIYSYELGLDDETFLFDENDLMFSIPLTTL